jgi:hypothetical protein
MNITVKTFWVIYSTSLGGNPANKNFTSKPIDTAFSLAAR